MKANRFIVYGISFILFLNGCSPSVQITGSWVNKEKIKPGSVKTIFIAVLSQNTNVKQVVESDMAAEAVKRGYKAIKSLDAFPPNFTKENAPDKETVMARVKSLGCDAILTSALIDRETEERYVPGTTTYAPYPAYGYYGTYWGYYNRWYPTVYSPGYYTQDKKYYFESNLYDVTTGEILWSIQSKAINPPKLAELSKQYVAALIQQLEKEGLLKKE